MCVLHNWLQISSSSYFYRGCVDQENHENGAIIERAWRKKIKGLGYLILLLLMEAIITLKMLQE